MIRKLLLPALLVGLLGGCVTGYGYRDGYYYGQPSVEYRYYDYGYPGYYGYGYYPYGERYRYYNYYGLPYYNPYYGRYPYYYNPYYHHHKPKPPVTGTPNPPPGDHRDDDRPPPWRDLDRRRRGGVARDALPSQPQVRPAPRRESRDEGSGMGRVIRRAQETRRGTSTGSREP